MDDVEGETLNKGAILPSYTSTGSARDEPPPSYESLFGKIKRTKEESHGMVDFTQNACKLCCSVICGSFVGLVILSLFMALPIAMVVIGSIHVHDCPVERNIPIYLVVGGSFSLLCFLPSLCGCRGDRGNRNEDSHSPCVSSVISLASCFIIAWFIAGNVWVYRTHGIWSTDPLSPNYCHETLYLFAFWQVTASYIMLGVILVLVVCCNCLLCCLPDIT